jgi:hypothetical protein
MENHIIIICAVGTLTPSTMQELIGQLSGQALQVHHAGDIYQDGLQMAVGNEADLLAELTSAKIRPVVIETDTAPSVSLTDILDAVKAGTKELKALLTGDKKKKGGGAADPVHSAGSQDKTTSEKSGPEAKSEMKENHPEGGGEADSKTEPAGEDTTETTQTESKTTSEE